MKHDRGAQDRAARGEAERFVRAAEIWLRDGAKNLKAWYPDLYLQLMWALYYQDITGAKP